MTGLSRDRVAELIVTTPDGRQRGCGYRVTTDTVLTAAHVLADAESVVVRFSPDLPDEWSVEASSWWAGSSDLALVTISGEPVPPALFGRVGDRAAVIAVESVGFPLWKFRSSYRDAFHATGTVAVLSNWRSGTLEFSLSPAPDAPWNGMSGAALWSGDRIVGVITAHHSSDGPARLEATRVDQALLDRLGVSAWPDVVPEAPADRVLSAYREQLSETAPAVLLDRAEELDSLVRFCAGDAPYLWLQAGPWAGKSALLSSFVLRYLPRGVDVVSFFITSRFAGQSDSDAFTEAMIEQLAALVDEPSSTLVQSPARRGHLARLLREAAQRSVEAGRRLLLVVDGLDEDTGQSSIAALLPTSVPPGVRVLVASRPHPGLPDDVPPGHPLQTLEPSPLTGSPHARDIAKRAKLELRAALHGSEDERTVLGLITASGGGLTRADLEEATGWAPYRIDLVLEGRLARSLSHRPSSSLYVFSHETLRELALQQLGATLDSYRSQLHAWADRYQGWPATTPIYLMRGYPRMLAASGNLPRLLALATDRDRHERLLEYSGGDALAQIEIANATNLAAQHQDIGALLLLAVLRDELADRNSRIPHDLPAVWVKLGEPTRALALAQGIADHKVRAYALIAMAEAAYPEDRYRADRRILDKLEREIKKCTDSYTRDWAVSLLAVAAAEAGWREDAARLATAVQEHDLKLEAEVACATAWGDLDRAGRLAARIAYHSQRARTLMKVLKAAAAQQDPELVRRMADAVQEAIFAGDKQWHIPVEPLVELAAFVGGTGDQDRRDELLKAASDLGIIIDLSILVDGGLHEQARTLIASREQKVLQTVQRLESKKQNSLSNKVWLDMLDLVRAMAKIGEFDRAEQLTMKIRNPDRHDNALAALAGAVAAAGHHDRGERLAVTITDLAIRARAMTWVAAAQQGAESQRLIDNAERYARQTVDSWRRGVLLAGLARPVALVGAQELAQRIATIVEQKTRGDGDADLRLARPWMVKAQRAIEDYDRAELDDVQETAALALDAIALAADGDLDGARELAAAALQGLRSLELEDDLELVAEALMAVGDLDAAVDLVTEAGTTDWESGARRAVATRLAAGGNYPRAEQIVAAIDEEPARSLALAELAAVVPEDVARRLVTEVLTSKTWQPAVGLAAKLIGPQVVEIAEYLLD